MSQHQIGTKTYQKVLSKGRRAFFRFAIFCEILGFLWIYLTTLYLFFRFKSRRVGIPGSCILLFTARWLFGGGGGGREGVVFLLRTRTDCSLRNVECNSIYL